MKALIVLCALIATFLFCFQPVQPVPEKWAARVASGCVLSDGVICVHEGCFISPQIIKLDSANYNAGLAGPPRSLDIRHATGWVTFEKTTIRKAKSIACIIRHSRKE